MRFNGLARFVIDAAEAGYDDDGLPIAGGGGVVYSQPIPCSIKAVTDNRLARYEDGTFHQQSFTVLIEAHAMEQDFYASKALELTLEDGKTVKLPIATITKTAQLGAVQITL